MNNKEFLLEIHKYIDEKYELFSNYQKIVQDIYNVFFSICEKNNILHFAVAGSLLGIIRDNGCIPWDYDFDVAVLYKDLNKLIAALNNELPDDYYYVYKNNTRNYVAGCLRVCKKGFTYMAIHLDVFFCIGAPLKTKSQIKFERKIRNVLSIRWSKNWRYHLPLEQLSIGDYLVEFIKKIRNLFYSEQRLNRIEHKICTKYDYDSSNVVGYFCYPMLCMDKKAIDKNVIVEKNGNKFSIPVNYKEVLRKRFGDNIDYLPIEERFDEFYSALNIVNKRQDFYIRREK